jgi:hypothetical protein
MGNVHGRLRARWSETLHSPARFFRLRRLFTCATNSTSPYLFPMRRREGGGLELNRVDVFHPGLAASRVLDETALGEKAPASSAAAAAALVTAAATFLARGIASAARRFADACRAVISPGRGESSVGRGEGSVAVRFAALGAADCAGFCGGGLPGANL